MPLPFAELNLQEGFVPALWTGFFQLAALALIGFWVNVVYQRYRAVAAARQELIDEIDQFTVLLYKPRRLYVAMLEESPALLAGIPDAVQRQAHRAALMEQCLSELFEAIGRFRSLQVKMVPLYGYNVELFGYYLVIWRYLKEVRYRMEQGQSLYCQPEDSRGGDVFYALIDTFRYRVITERAQRYRPQPTQAPEAALKRMRQRADALYQQHFPALTTSCPPAAD
jgi:hypothetical protein